MYKKNHGRQKLLSFLVTALLTSSAFAVDSLHSYLLKAQNNDPDFLGARASYEAEFENRALGRAGLFPTINFTIGTTRVAESRRDPTNDTGIDHAMAMCISSNAAQSTNPRFLLALLWYTTIQLHL